MINGFVTKKNLLNFFLIVVILSRKKSKSALRSENVPKKLCTLHCCNKNKVTANAINCMMLGVDVYQKLNDIIINTFTSL